MTFEFNYLPWAELASSAQFYVAIDRDTAFRDHRLCRAAAVAQPRHFQQVIELDKFLAFQLKIVHVFCPVRRDLPDSFAVRTSER